MTAAVTGWSPVISRTPIPRAPSSVSTARAAGARGVGQAQQPDRREPAAHRRSRRSGRPRRPRLVRRSAAARRPPGPASPWRPAWRPAASAARRRAARRREHLGCALDHQPVADQRGGERPAGLERQERSRVAWSRLDVAAKRESPAARRTASSVAWSARPLRAKPCSGPRSGPRPAACPDRLHRLTCSRFSHSVPVLSKHTTSSRASASTELALRINTCSLESRRAAAS